MRLFDKDVLEALKVLGTGELASTTNALAGRLGCDTRKVQKALVRLEREGHVRSEYSDLCKRWLWMVA